MRTFKTDGVSYFEFKIEGSEEVYKVPLAADMPNGILSEMRNAAGTDRRFDVQVDMLRKYMGPVTDELSPKVLGQILQAWGEASNESGASVGES